MLKLFGHADYGGFVRFACRWFLSPCHMSMTVFVPYSGYRLGCADPLQGEMREMIDDDERAERERQRERQRERERRERETKERKCSPLSLPFPIVILFYFILYLFCMVVVLRQVDSLLLLCIE